MISDVTDDYGWESADAPRNASYLNPIICEIVQDWKAVDVLDAGCGNGALCGDLALRGFNVVGIDSDKRGVELAESQNSKAVFMVGSFSSYVPLDGFTADGLFDCVVSTEVVEHLYAPHELASFAMAALRPGGVFIISTPYHGYLKNLALSLLNKWDYHHWALWHGGHIKFWSRKTLTKLLEEAKFEFLAFHGVGRIPYLWRSMIIVAQKPSR